MDLAKFLEQAQDKRILVVGDVMIDRYLWGSVNRISPEAPVPVVEIEREENRLGGAANVALNLQSLGASVHLAGLIGRDEMGEAYQQLMAAQGFETDLLLALRERKTTVKIRVLGNNQQMLRLDKEDLHSPQDSEPLKHWQEKVLTAIPQVDAVILQDYDKGALWPEWIEKLIQTANQHAVPILVDPKFRQFFEYKNCQLFKPNLRELEQGLGQNLESIEALPALMEALRERLPHKETIITLSSKGMMLMDENSNFHMIPAHPRQIADVSGAGDTVISVLGLAYAQRLASQEAAQIANLAGGLVCEEVGVVPIRPERLLESS